jgi:hypothetical protein
MKFLLAAAVARQSPTLRMYLEVADAASGLPQKFHYMFLYVYTYICVGFKAMYAAALKFGQCNLVELALTKTRINNSQL